MKRTLAALSLSLLLSVSAGAQSIVPYITPSGNFNIPQGNQLQLSDPANQNQITFLQDSSQNLKVQLNGATPVMTLNGTTGALTVPGAATISGTVTGPGTQTLGTVGTAAATGLGNSVFPLPINATGGIDLTPSSFGTGQTALLGIYVSSVIPVTSSYLVITSSSAGNQKQTAIPSISTVTVVGATFASSPIPDGFVLVVTSSGTPVITFQSNGTLSGSALRLGAATRAITAGNTLTLIWVKSLAQWVELAFSAGTGN